MPLAACDMKSLQENLKKLKKNTFYRNRATIPKELHTTTLLVTFRKQTVNNGHPTQNIWMIYLLYLLFYTKVSTGPFPIHEHTVQDNEKLMELSHAGVRIFYKCIARCLNFRFTKHFTL